MINFPFYNHVMGFLFTPFILFNMILLIKIQLKSQKERILNENMNTKKIIMTILKGIFSPHSFLFFILTLYSIFEVLSAITCILFNFIFNEVLR
jgi:hypothetical protein